MQNNDKTVIISVLLFVILSSTYVFAAESTQVRILHFPQDRSMGMLAVRDAGVHEKPYQGFEEFCEARGDVAVFVFPEDKSKDYIKRVVGLPGDTIVYQDNRLTVNGQEIPLSFKSKFNYFLSDGSMDITALYEEQLNGVTHSVLRKEFSIRDGEWKVPEGHYMVLGDNRNNSRDSRFWGFVPQSFMIGRAAIIWWSWDSIKGAPRWERIGQLIE